MKRLVDFDLIATVHIAFVGDAYSAAATRAAAIEQFRGNFPELGEPTVIESEVVLVVPAPVAAPRPRLTVVTGGRA